MTDETQEPMGVDPEEEYISGLGLEQWQKVFLASLEMRKAVLAGLYSKDEMLRAGDRPQGAKEESEIEFWELLASGASVQEAAEHDPDQANYNLGQIGHELFYEALLVIQSAMQNEENGDFLRAMKKSDREIVNSSNKDEIQAVVDKYCQGKKVTDFVNLWSERYTQNCERIINGEGYDLDLKEEMRRKIKWVKASKEAALQRAREFDEKLGQK